MNRSHRALLCLFLSNGLIGVLVGCARQPVPILQGEADARKLAQVAFKDSQSASQSRTTSPSSESGPGNYYADDAGGKMLAELLRPVDPPPLKPTEPIASPRK